MRKPMLECLSESNIFPKRRSGFRQHIRVTSQKMFHEIETLLNRFTH